MQWPHLLRRRKTGRTKHGSADMTRLREAKRDARAIDSMPGGGLGMNPDLSWTDRSRQDRRSGQY